MKKIISIFLVILLIGIFFAGCGKDEKIEEDVDIDVKSNGNEMTVKNGDTEMNVALNLNQSVDLPEGYPENVLPIYKDLFILSGSKNADGSFVITGLSSDVIADVGNFYDGIFEDGKIIMHMFDEDGYTAMGELENYSYTVLLVDETDGDTDYKTSVSIVLLPGDLSGITDPFNIEEDESKEDQDKSNDDSKNSSKEMVIPEDKEIPDSYPEDILPFEKGEETELAVIMTQNGQEMLGYMSTSEIEEVFEYYKNMLIKGQYFTITNDTENDKGIISKLDGIQFQIILHRNDENTGEDLKYKTLIQIIY